MCGPSGDETLSIFEAFPDFSELHAKGFDGVTCAKPTVMIAMTARTGSTHLCAALAQTDGIPPPNEIFNPRGVLHMEAQRRGVRLFADFIRSFNEDPGPCFIFKTNWQDFLPLAPFYRQIFPNLRVIFLDRRDLIAQAVSLYRAAETGKWHVERGKALEEPPDDALLDTLNLKEMSWWIAQLEAEKRQWKQFFAAEKIDPFRLFYEDFALDVTKAVSAISDYLGIPLKTEIGPDVGFQKLADKVNDAWVDRVRRHVLRMT